MNESYKKYAKLIVNEVVCVKPGEKVLIEVTDADDGLACEMIRAVYAAGGRPFYHQLRDSLQSVWISGADEETVRMQATWDVQRMQEMDVYISLRLNKNPYDMAEIPIKQSQMYRTFYERPVHFQTRIPHTRWLATCEPNEAVAQSAGMATESFVKFYFESCCIDYKRFAQRMKPLADLMQRTDQVRIKGESVDLSFSIKDKGVCVCRGTHNIPAGEVFTAPVIDSAEGYIRYNTPTFFDNELFEGVQLELHEGKIVSYSCQRGNQAHMDAIFATDEGARHIGEFAMGTNPFIERVVGSILFDEKAAGSFHFTPGNAYETCGNGNVSKIHWDMVYRMQPEYGGGEIWFDDVLIQKDGLYLPEELQPLNPALLKKEIAL